MLLESSKALSQKISESADKVASVTKLVTDQLAIGQLALFNGFEDANEILKNALGEDPRLGSLSSYADKYLSFAARAKLVTLASDLLSLTAEEKNLFHIQVLVKDFGVGAGGADMLEHLLGAVSTIRNQEPSDVKRNK